LTTQSEKDQPDDKKLINTLNKTGCPNKNQNLGWWKTQDKTTVLTDMYNYCTITNNNGRCVPDDSKTTTSETKWRHESCATIMDKDICKSVESGQGGAGAGSENWWCKWQPSQHNSFCCGDNQECGEDKLSCEQLTDWVGEEAPSNLGPDGKPPVANNPDALARRQRSLSKGAIAGIIIGSVVGAAGITIGIYYLIRYLRGRQVVAAPIQGFNNKREKKKS